MSAISGSVESSIQEIPRISGIKYYLENPTCGKKTSQKIADYLPYTIPDSNSSKLQKTVYFSTKSLKRKLDIDGWFSDRVISNVVKKRGSINCLFVRIVHKVFGTIFEGNEDKFTKINKKIGHLDLLVVLNQPERDMFAVLKSIFLFVYLNDPASYLKKGQIRVNNLCKKIGYLKALKVLSHPGVNEERMLKTFTRIVKQQEMFAIEPKPITHPIHGKVIRSRRTKEKITYGFTLTQDEIYVRIGYLGEGQYKKVRDTLALKAAISVATYTVKDTPTKRFAVKKFIDENILLRNLKSKKVEHIQDPCLFIYKNQGKAIGITGKLTGDIRIIQPDEVGLIYLIFISVLKAVNSLHQLELIHNDIKPANIFFERDYKGRFVRVVLGDFGLCRAITVMEHIRIGTKFYSPPEDKFWDQESGKSTSPQSKDGYGIGISLIELLGHYFPETDEEKCLQNIKDPNDLRKAVLGPLDIAPTKLTKKDLFKKSLLVLATELIHPHEEARSSCQKALMAMEVIGTLYKSEI